MTGGIMLHIAIYNLQKSDLKKSNQDQLQLNIIAAVTGNSDFRISNDEISIQYFKNQRTSLENAPVSIDADWLDNKGNQDHSTRQLLAQKIGECFRTTIRSWRKDMPEKFTVVVTEIDPTADGVWNS
jgi:hypothetical protein